MKMMYRRKNVAAFCKNTLKFKNNQSISKQNKNKGTGRQESK